MTPNHKTWILFYPTELKFSLHIGSKFNKMPDTFQSEQSDNSLYK